MRDLLFFACYLLPAAVLGFYLPQWLPLMDRGVAIGLGVALLLGGGLLHEVRARMRADRLRGEQMVELRQALFHLQDELIWARRENRALGEAIEAVARSGRVGRSGQGGRAIEEVMAEVKALKSLVHQKPASRAPARQVPATEASTAETPATQTPVTQAPATQTPATQTPATQTPATQTAASQAPAEPSAEPSPLPPEEAAPVEIASVPPTDERPPEVQKPRKRRKASAPPVVLEPLPRPPDEASMLDAVRAALRDDRVELALQPIVALPQRKVRHVECFSRLRDPDGTLVLPEQYIALAEREGLITAIDNMLLLRCVQLVRQVQRRGDKSGFFCNISPHTLRDEDFFGDFVDFLDANEDLAPAMVFEFTQADLARQGPAESRHLDRLAMLGCRFSIDKVEDLDMDAMALARRRVAFVKVEAAKLLAEAERDIKAPHRLKRALARAGIDLVVEKLEDEATLRELLDCEIDFGQGFLFGEPRALEAA